MDSCPDGSASHESAADMRVLQLRAHSGKPLPAVVGRIVTPRARGVIAERMRAMRNGGAMVERRLKDVIQGMIMVILFYDRRSRPTAWMRRQVG